MSEEQRSYDEGACESILDTAKSVYSEELSRFTQYESKTNMGLAFVGVLLGAYLTYLSSYKLIFKDPGYIIYSALFKITILTLFTLGIIYFLRSIKSGEYHQVDLANIVDLNFAQSQSTTVKIEIAATYKQAIDQNKQVLERKARHYDYGLNYTFLGFILFVLHFLIEVTLKYVH